MHQNHQAYGANLPAQFNITMLQLMETGTYEDVYQRPYKSEINQTVVRAFQESTMGGSNINVNTVSGIAGEIMRPAAEIAFNSDGSRRAVDIPGGFGQKRFLFVMEVVFPMGGFASGGGIRQLVSGFTDHPGATHQSGLKVHLDPNMRLYINAVTTIRTVEMQGPNGTYLQETVADDSQILAGRYDLSGGGFGSQGMDLHTRTMRPQDIFHTRQLEFYQDAPTIDARTNFAQGVKKSRRLNNVAPDYLSRVTTAWQTAAGQAGVELENDQVIAGRASGLVADSSLAKDRFLRALSDAANFQRTGFISYGDLCRLQPGLDNIADVRFQDTRSIHQAHQRGQGEYWHGQSAETVMATILFQAVPAIMIPLMLARCRLMITNRTVGMEYDIRAVELWGFQRMPIDAQRFALFADRLKSEVLRDLTQNNLIDVAMELTIDVLGESSVKISIQGKPAVPFTVPSFCDARYTPVLTEQPQLLQDIAHDMASLCQGANITLGGSVNGPNAANLNTQGPPLLSTLPLAAPGGNPDRPPGAGSPIIMPGQAGPSTNFMNKV